MNSPAGQSREAWTADRWQDLDDGCLVGLETVDINVKEIMQVGTPCGLCNQLLPDGTQAGSSMYGTAPITRSGRL